jgi:uncharacterized RDD family membrane protein YckC
MFTLLLSRIQFDLIAQYLHAITLGVLVFIGNCSLPVGFFARLDMRLLIMVFPLDITLEHPFYPLYVIYVYIIAVAFFGWSWTHGGQTLGMKTWHFCVEQENGQMVTWAQALLRFLSAATSWLPFCRWLHLVPVPQRSIGVSRRDIRHAPGAHWITIHMRLYSAPRKELSHVV